ncbi:hypothetical protein RhiirA4_493155 [Rhizophagus irregularis]|uniref:Uncharacterized protein n=1 Tax=Rhizophagus irregularis TaxID=588596 RepID=A0A2I1HXL3_9GLOM|nr:hypothetical protein RhiirA4_493155 [Rhizophagus irregularis]
MKYSDSETFNSESSYFNKKNKKSIDIKSTKNIEDKSSDSKLAMKIKKGSLNRKNDTTRMKK